MRMEGQAAWVLDPAAPIAPQIALILRERIIRNEFSPGHRISETEIARSCKVSRQPVREAFIKLSGQGLLEILPQRGTIISRIDCRAVLDARFLREAIEADIVRILARDPDPAAIAELERQVAAQRALPAEDAFEFIRLDERFHRTLAEAAGKAGAWKLVEGLKSQMDRVRFLALGQFPSGKLVAQHARIVAGIAAGTMGPAEDAIRWHLREVLSDLPEIVATCPDFFETPEGALTPSINAPFSAGGDQP